MGLRPINALVDITNFMTLDRNRPLHVFDAAKVTGNLTVRRAKAGETILALDGKTYTLTDEQVVIADEHGVESLAGIMGGEASGSSEATTDVLIESALWDPLNIARSGRALGINSDARYRFERGVDPDFARPGLDLATALVIELCGGEASEMEFVGELPDSPGAIDFPWSEVKRLTGLELPQAEMKLALTSLGFHVSGAGDRVKVAPPSWRADVGGKADLVEEIVRIAGLDRVASTPLPRIKGEVIKPVLTVLQKRTRIAKRTLAAQGQRVEALADDAALAPKRQQRTGQLPAAIGIVMSDVDRRGGAVILAACKNHRGVAEAAQVLGKRLRLEQAHVRGAPARPVELRITLDHALRHRRGLDQEEPVPIGAGEGIGRAAIHLAGRRDVEGGELQHAFAMVERQAVRDAGATIMRADEEALVAQRAHDLGHVMRHGALRVWRVVGVARRLFGIAVAAQVRADQGETLSQSRGDPAPHHMGLRIAVEQQQRRPLPARPHTNPRARRLNVEQAKTGEQIVRDGTFGEQHRTVEMQECASAYPESAGISRIDYYTILINGGKRLPADECERARPSCSPLWRASTS